MDTEKQWLDEAIKYEKGLRRVPVKELCNRAAVENLRYTLRVALEKLQAAQQSVHLTGGESAPLQALSTPEVDSIGGADTTPPAIR